MSIETRWEYVVDPLLDFYDSQRRILPWREEPTPYHVWVSEIMLQQTRVEAVKAYYKRFMDALPDIRSLAEAEEEMLLKLWEGLGYYNRVRNLHKAAQIIVEQYDGEMPDSYEEIIGLPGIGSYTAGAIASIAFGICRPAVDGNVLRVLSRLRGDSRDIMQQSVRTSVEQELLEVIPAERPGDFNQALMELGAMVCTPNGAPQCERCPWEKVCVAHGEGKELQFPVKAPKKERVIEEKTILIIRDGERAAIRKRPGKGLLAGMYEFPSVTGHLSEDEVLSYLKEKGLSAIHIAELPKSKHIFSHREWHMTGYAIKVDELADKSWDDSLIFVDTKEVKEQYPIPTAYQVYRKAFLEDEEKYSIERRGTRK